MVLKDEDKYRVIVETAKEIILTFDMRGKITFMNERGTERIGYFDDEIPGMDIADILPPHHLKTIKEKLLYSHAAGDRKAVFHSAEFLDRNLNLFPAEISASLIVEQGKPSDILLVARESAGDRKEEKKDGDGSLFAHIVAQAEEMVVIAHADGKIAYVNRAGERLSGYMAEELRGTDISDLLPPKHSGLIREKLLRQGDVVVSEEDFLDRNLKAVPAEIRSDLIPGDGGARNILITVRDLTRQKKKRAGTPENAEIRIPVRACRGHRG